MAVAYRAGLHQLGKAYPPELARINALTADADAEVRETERNRAKQSPEADNGARAPYLGSDGQRDLTAHEYALATGLHVQTVYGWCRDSGWVRSVPVVGSSGRERHQRRRRNEDVEPRQ